LPPVTSLNATGVSCASATACVAVGYARLNVSGPYQADVFAEVWNGSTWVMGSPSLPTTTGYAQLNGVGCSGGSPTGCTAVGVYSPAYSSSQFTLGERYAG
jgi:hypothetical protein